MTTTEKIIEQIVMHGFCVQIWEHAAGDHVCFAVVQMSEPSMTLTPGRIEVQTRQPERHVGFTIPKPKTAPTAFDPETATATVRGLIDAELTVAAEKLGIKLVL